MKKTIDADPLAAEQWLEATARIKGKDLSAPATPPRRKPGVLDKEKHRCLN